MAKQHPYMRRMPPFSDLAALVEDERIDTIGEAAQVASERGVGFVIDNEPEKIARYKRKILERFPAVEIFSELVGTGVYALMVRPRVDPVKAN